MRAGSFKFTFRVQIDRGAAIFAGVFIAAIEAILPIHDPCFYAVFHSLPRYMAASYADPDKNSDPHPFDIKSRHFGIKSETGGFYRINRSFSRPLHDQPKQNHFITDGFL